MQTMAIIAFSIAFLLILVSLGLFKLHAMILAWWERCPSVQRRREAEEAEAERRAQAELRRVLLIEAERKARMQDQQIICLGIAQGILSALQEVPVRQEQLAASPHQQRIQRNLAHFCWCLAHRIVPQILAAERGPAASLEERAAQHRAEIEVSLEGRAAQRRAEIDAFAAAQASRSRVSASDGEVMYGTPSR